MRKFIRNFIARLKTNPLTKVPATKVHRLFSANNWQFPGSTAYWERRYAKGGNSGSGSYNKLARFKARIINKFVLENQIQSIIEFGCGDGNQLSLMNFPEYIGLDVSATALSKSIQKFEQDLSKSFFLYHSSLFVDHAKIFSSELAISLDVTFHLVEDQIFTSYMRHLFASSTKYIIIYSRDFDRPQDFHEKDRKFTAWINKNIFDFELIGVTKNEFPFDPNSPDETSHCDFYFYKKI